jgi:hypothetical protein
METSHMMITSVTSEAEHHLIVGKIFHLQTALEWQGKSMSEATNYMLLCSKDIDYQRASTFFWTPLYVPDALSPEVKWPGCEAHQSQRMSMSRKCASIHALPISLYGIAFG